MSTLLIGNDSGSMTLGDSIRAIVRGVLEANRRLRATELWDCVRIDCLEFVELFEDVAEQAAHVVNALPECSAGAHAIGRYSPTPQLGAVPGGEYSRPPEENRAQGWWRRVQVSGKPSRSSRGGAATSRPSSSSTRPSPTAPSSQSTAVQSLPQVSRLVEASMLQSTVDLKLSNTLFELLLPTSVKNSFRMAAIPAAAQSLCRPISVRADGGRESMAGPNH